MNRKTPLKNPVEIPHNIVSFDSFFVARTLFRVFRGPNELRRASRVIKSTFAMQTKTDVKWNSDAVRSRCTLFLLRIIFFKDIRYRCECPNEGIVVRVIEISNSVVRLVPVFLSKEQAAK